MPPIISRPNIKDTRKTDTFGYVWDLMPTMLEIAGIGHPKTHKGKPMEPMRGRCLAPQPKGKTETDYDKKELVGGELMNGKWIRQGASKVTAVTAPYGGRKIGFIISRQHSSQDS